MNSAFDALENAFGELAEIEDRQQDLIRKMEGLEGSRKGDQLKKRLQALQLEMAAAQRCYRLAGMRADRVRLLLDVQKTALGRD